MFYEYICLLINNMNVCGDGLKFTQDRALMKLFWIVSRPAARKWTAGRLRMRRACRRRRPLIIAITLAELIAI